MSRIPSLTDWPTSGAVMPKGSHLQQQVDAIRALGDAEGYSEGNAGEPQLNKWILGKIVDAGPAGEVDYTDERYWVQLLGVTGSDPDAKIVVEDDGLEDHQIITAINLFEWLEGTHYLRIGEIIWMRAKLDRGDPVSVHWLFRTPAGFTGGITRFGRVHWDGLTLTQDTHGETFVNGVLISRTDDTTVLIDTTTGECP